MKKFIITFKNLENGEPFYNLIEANEILGAVHKAEKLCKIFKKYGVCLEIVSVIKV